MAESKGELRVGGKVLVKDKGLEGTVRYVGSTLFAPGKWIGIELDEPKGKNNGTVQGKTYFQCPENCGIMVRQNQLQVLPDAKPSHSVSRIPGPSNIPTPSSSKRPSSAGKKGSSPQGQSKSPRNAATPGRQQLPGMSPQLGVKKLAAAVEKVAREPSPTVAETHEEPLPVAVGAMSGETPELTDLNQRLAILQSKRAEDKVRIKELEKYKAHYQQMMEYKQRWSESQSDLQQQLKAAKKETREYQLAKERAEEEMRDLSETVEMATLDKEMAEERSEGLQAEVEALKEKVEELTIDLEIIKQEISEGGVEGAAANAQLKQLEQQNSRLKEALLRLRDLSTQDKLEHQRVIKDMEKSSQELNQVREQKEKMAQELQEADAVIDELKEQVDAALGAEEMVEKLTDTNLELEEKMEKLNETVADLEALRDLSEEQEELRMEVEHDLREELDMSLNNVREMERKLEATQETIIDQQQTIEKFRDLVHNLNADLAEYRSKGERSEGGASNAQSQAAVMNLNVQLKSASKTQARTIDFELRKLEASQATEHIKLLLSFMPNSFLVSGGDYDALLVLMMLPRMTFKADLVINQLKQQHKLDEALGSLSSVNPSRADQLAFVCTLIYKLTTLNMLVSQANRILKECDMQLYRQMGNVRDDLNIHEKALDILIELMKKEQLDESVPLHGVDKAISHFESLLERRLVQEGGSVLGQSALLLDQMVVVSSGSDVISMQLLRLRGLAPDSSEFVAQMKEMDSFNNDLRQSSRKVRRKIPTADSNRILLYDSNVADVHSKILRRQQLLTETFKALHLRASQRANSLTDGEKLTSGELQEFIRHVIDSGTLQEAGSEVSAQSPKDRLRSVMSLSSVAIEKFLSDLSEGIYDSPYPKTKLDAPVGLRARSVKAELSDVEGLGFKLEERQQDILQLRKNLKMKAQELSEANVKISLLEKKVDSTDSVIASRVAAEKEETAKMRSAMDIQERQFQKTIAILQGDIENLESERVNLEKKLDQQPTRKSVIGDLKLGGSKIRTLGGQGTPYGTSPHASPMGSPYVGRKAGDVALDDGAERVSLEQNPLLLSRVESLNKALGFSVNENFRLKVQIAKAQMNSLTPLKVPRQLLRKKSRSTDSSQAQSQDEGGASAENQTDQEKTVVKKTASLIEDLKKMCLSPAITSGKPHPQQDGVSADAEKGSPGPREQLANRMARLFEMQRRASELKDDVGKMLASEYPGGQVTTHLASFSSPQFTKVLAEGSQPSVLAARLHLPPHAPQRACNKVVLSPAQFHTLHMAVVS